MKLVALSPSSALSTTFDPLVRAHFLVRPQLLTRISSPREGRLPPIVSRDTR